MGINNIEKLLSVLALEDVFITLKLALRYFCIVDCIVCGNFLRVLNQNALIL